nr:MAG TPA: hypothetical protein [Caudoviricetes sp.]
MNNKNKFMLALMVYMCYCKWQISNTFTIFKTKDDIKTEKHLQNFRH